MITVTCWSGYSGPLGGVKFTPCISLLAVQLKPPSKFGSSVSVTVAQYGSACVVAVASVAGGQLLNPLAVRVGAGQLHGKENRFVAEE